MKVIFLDVDGVLNNSKSKSRCGESTGCDMDKIRLLERIVRETGAILVLSSDWKLSPDHMKYLKNKLGKRGLKILDKTPNVGSKGIEIQKWFEKNDDIKVENWIVLDDKPIEGVTYRINDKIPIIKRHLVKTQDYYNPQGGLSETDVEKAISILNRRE